MKGNILTVEIILLMEDVEEEAELEVLDEEEDGNAEEDEVGSAATTEVELELWDVLATGVLEG